jgi:lipoprotein-anchoring transpeptidase ErfK/SrfK
MPGVGPPISRRGKGVAAAQMNYDTTSVMIWWLMILLMGGGVAVSMTQEDIVSVQATLDDAGFSPGLIDGSWGGLTRQALAAWQAAQGLPATGELDRATVAHFPARGPVYTNLEVTAADVTGLTAIPEDWRERSQLPAMNFATVSELVAERAHASVGLIRTLNPGLSNAVPQTVTVPVLRPVRLPKAARLQVSLAGKTITAFDATGKVLALFPCSIAADQEKRPVGPLTVTVVAVNPDYTFDPENFPELDARQRGYGKLMIPPGPNNPVGTAWIGLSRPGYGMHGTPHPEQIGKTFSHGCFRLANWNAERLAQMVSVGTPVEVMD